MTSRRNIIFGVWIPCWTCKWCCSFYGKIIRNRILWHHALKLKERKSEVHILWKFQWNIWCSTQSVKRHAYNHCRFCSNLHKLIQISCRKKLPLHAVNLFVVDLLLVLMYWPCTSAVVRLELMRSTTGSWKSCVTCWRTIGIAVSLHSHNVASSVHRCDLQWSSERFMILCLWMVLIVIRCSCFLITDVHVIKVRCCSLEHRDGWISDLFDYPSLVGFLLSGGIWSRCKALLNAALNSFGFLCILISEWHLDTDQVIISAISGLVIL